MRNAAAKVERHETRSSSHAADQFALELSDLCRKYGLGVGDATLFEMQPEDYQFNYHVSEDDKLQLG